MTVIRPASPPPTTTARRTGGREREAVEFAAMRIQRHVGEWTQSVKRTSEEPQAPALGVCRACRGGRPQCATHGKGTVRATVRAPLATNYNYRAGRDTSAPMTSAAK